MTKQLKLQDVARALTKIPDEGAADYMQTTLCTAVNLIRILENDPSDFAIFQNGWNKGIPSIWSGRAARVQVKTLKKDKPKLLYAYRVEGKDAVLKMPEFDLRRVYIHWNKADKT